MQCVAVDRVCLQDHNAIGCGQIETHAACRSGNNEDELVSSWVVELVAQSETYQIASAFLRVKPRYGLTFLCRYAAIKADSFIRHYATVSVRSGNVIAAVPHLCLASAG